MCYYVGNWKCQVTLIKLFQRKYCESNQIHLLKCRKLFWKRQRKGSKKHNYNLSTGGLCSSGVLLSFERIPSQDTYSKKLCLLQYCLNDAASDCQDDYHFDICCSTPDCWVNLRWQVLSPPKHTQNACRNFCRKFDNQAKVGTEVDRELRSH